MSQSIDHEINLLCVGDVLSGKQSFLEHYTKSTHQQLHYRVYSLIHQNKNVVFLHEVQEREGMDAYLSYPYDGVLYFLNIHEFHNPCWTILDQLTQLSKLNGTNIYSIPMKVIVLSSKVMNYESINPIEKRNFLRQLDGMISESMVIFVENNDSHINKLDDFYQSIINGETEGLTQNFYINWQLKGLVGLIPFEGLLLSLKKTKQTIYNLWKKINVRLKMKQF